MRGMHNSRFLSSSIATVRKMVEWMEAHDQTLPVRRGKSLADPKQAEQLLRRQFNYLKNKIEHAPEISVLFDQIKSRSVVVCNQVLDWLATHEEALPVRYGSPDTLAKRDEQLLRRQFDYVKSKSDHPPETCALLEEIECRTASLPDSTTCKKVLEWMDVHEKALPKEFRKPATDAQRAEYLLRNKFENLKRKNDHPPVVRALLDQIEFSSSQVPELKLCLAVLAWMDAHENALPMERKVFANNGQRDECFLARRWRGCKRRKSHTPETSTLLAKIQSRSSQAIGPCRLRACHVAMQAKKVILRKPEKHCGGPSHSYDRRGLLA
jgi:hypothetical protein